MTLSDTDLEARLRRDLRARADDVPPAPRDLAALTRERHRRLRRREYGLVAAAVAAALVFAGVPVVASTFATDGDRGQTARPTTTGGPVRADEEIYTTPTRGGLADEDDWLDAVAALPWRTEDASSPRDPGMALPEPPRDTRRVAYADDVPSGRVALVVGISGEEVVHAWFVGPRDAEAREMTMARYPGMFGTDVAGLVDGEPDAETLTLVVVADPGDDVERPLIPVVDAAGNESAAIETLDLVDGIGVLAVERRWAESGATLFVRRAGGTSYGVAISDSLRVELARPGDVVAADPRGQAAQGETDPGSASSVGHVLAQFGLTAEEARPTLLAAGPLPLGRWARIFGVTFPSGATGMWLETFVPDDPDAGVIGTTLPFAPAGTALLDRVLAAETLGGLVVSAPSGVRAEVLDASGAVLESLPLTNGAGTGNLSSPPSAASVRILDGTGAVVASTEIIRVEG